LDVERLAVPSGRTIFIVPSDHITRFDSVQLQGACNHVAFISHDAPCSFLGGGFTILRQRLFVLIFDIEQTALRGLLFLFLFLSFSLDGSVANTRTTPHNSRNFSSPSVNGRLLFLILSLLKRSFQTETRSSESQISVLKSSRTE